MAFFDGLTHTEIAEITGDAVATVSPACITRYWP